MKKIITKNSLKTTTMNFDHDGSFMVKTDYEIGDILDSNKKQANEYKAGSLVGNTQKHQRKVADIPTVIYLELIEKFGQPKDNPKAWRKWLNDYDNRFFRTGGGTI